MLCDPKKLHWEALEIAVEIIVAAGARCSGYEQTKVLFDDVFNDILKEMDLRMEVGF